MASTLHHYRAYHLDRDGHIKHSEIISAESDEAALDRLRTTRNGHGIEMWDRARFVGKVAPYEPAVVPGAAAKPAERAFSPH